MIDFLTTSVATFTLVSFYGITSVYAFYYAHPTTYSRIYCKLFYYIIQLLSIIFRWNLAAASFDRYALSSTNVRLRRFANVRIAYRVVIAIVLVSLIFPLHNLIVYDLRTDIGSCSIVYGYPASLYNGIFTIINTTVIPVPIMIVCTLLIRRNLAQKQERRHGSIVQQQRRRNQQTLIMLFAQIGFYILLTVPYTIHGIYNAISMNIPNKSVDRLAIERLMLSIASVLIVLFPTLSFYVYTLISSMFRRELLIMLYSILCCKYNINNNNRIEPRRDHRVIAIPIEQRLTIRLKSQIPIRNLVPT